MKEYRLIYQKWCLFMYCTKYIYSNTNPNLIKMSTLILGTKVPHFFLTEVPAIASILKFT
jgi:hypothetical protein